MSDWLNNTRNELNAALTALEKLGVQDPTAYHLDETEEDYEDRLRKGYSSSRRTARPDLQSEARYNSIKARIDAIKTAKEAIRDELIYKLQPAKDRVD